jgi:hypothetical protein
MNREQKWLVTGGLLLITVGLVFGVVYGWLVGHGTLLVLKESYGSALRAAAGGDAAEMRSGAQAGQEANYRLVRAVDVHTHIIKMGTVVLLAGLLWPLLGSARKTRVALGLIGGAVVFPLGVFLEIYTHSMAAQAVAAIGAAVAILSFGDFCRRLLSPAQDSAK